MWLGMEQVDMRKLTPAAQEALPCRWTRVMTGRIRGRIAISHASVLIVVDGL